MWKIRYCRAEYEYSVLVRYSIRRTSNNSVRVRTGTYVQVLVVYLYSNTVIYKYSRYYSTMYSTHTGTEYCNLTVQVRRTDTGKAALLQVQVLVLFVLHKYRYDEYSYEYGNCTSNSVLSTTFSTSTVRRSLMPV